MIVTESTHQGTQGLFDPPRWCAEYVGIAFRSHGRDRSGCDCYGLLTLVNRERFGITLPLYCADYADACEQHEIAALISNVVEASPWRRIETARPGDAILLRLAGEPWHVGVVVASLSVVGEVARQRRAGEGACGCGWFLHVRPGADSCLERYDSLRWRRRIVGFYRYSG